MAGSRAAARVAMPKPDQSDRPETQPLPDQLDGLVGYHLRLAQEASFASFTQRVGDPDLKPGRYSILTILANNPGLTPTALSRACGRDKSTLTAALKDLEKRGLVARESMPGDQRSVRISLTSAGSALLARLRSHAEAHDQALDRIVGAENKAAFIAILNRITNVLTDGTLQGAAPRRRRHTGNE
jgi:DNA-binding MarR family transcriptional regulator